MRTLSYVGLHPSLGSFQQDSDIPMGVGHVEDQSIDRSFGFPCDRYLQSGQCSDHRRNSDAFEFSVFEDISSEPFHQIMCHKPVQQEGLDIQVLFGAQILQQEYPP